MNSTAPTKGELRRERIMQWIKREGRISLQEMIERLGCSEATARRDLDFLARSGQIIRTIGGAQLDQAGIPREVSFNEKKLLLRLEKEAVARKAASLVQEGDIIGLTGGTTTYLLARELKFRSGITVVTNAVNVAMELADNEDIQVVLTGGVIRGKSYELCGPLAEAAVERLNIGTMFLGIDGISTDGGITTYSELEAEIGRLMIQRSKRVIAVFDRSKAGQTSLFSYAPLSALHGCITDSKMDAHLTDRLNELQVEIHYANPEDL